MFNTCEEKKEEEKDNKQNLENLFTYIYVMECMMD